MRYSNKLLMFKPSVNRKWLIFISGALWAAIGIMLNLIASKWLPLLSENELILTYAVGLIFGSIVTVFGFSKLARKNSIRISGYPEKVCVFAFQRWQMYFLVAIMVGLGIFMRTTTFVPKYILAPFYVGMGLALFLSSFVYFKNFIQAQQKKAH